MKTKKERPCPEINLSTNGRNLPHAVDRCQTSVASTLANVFHSLIPSLMKSKTKNYFLFILIGVIISCKRETPTTWNVDLLGPIAHGRITLDDIIADSILQADENNLWHLILHEDLTDFDLDSIVSIPDTLIENVIDMPFTGGPFSIANGTTIINKHEDNLININGAEIRQIIAESGKLRYKIISYVNGYLLCNYELPGMQINGVGTTIETTTEPSVGNVPYVFEGEIDLANYNLDLTGQSGFSHNRIYSHLTITTSPTAPQNALIAGDDLIVVEMEFIEPKVRYAKGYFGNHHYTLNQTIDFGSNLNLPTGAINFGAVNMALQITNAVGADLTLQFQQLQSHNSYYNSNVDLSCDNLFDEIHIERASESSGTVAPNVYDILLNNQNSNIDEFIENLPDQLVLQAEVEINPLGDISDGQDFIYTANSLHALLDLDIPLSISMQSLTMSDTLAISNAIDIKANGVLQLYISNAFPFGTALRASVVDANGVIVQPLIASQQIAHAMPTAIDGQTIPVQSVLTINASQAAINSFVPTNRIALTVVFDSPEYPQLANLYKDYYMDFKLVGDGVFGVSVE